MVHKAKQFDMSGSSGHRYFSLVRSYKNQGELGRVSALNMSKTLNQNRAIKVSDDLGFHTAGYPVRSTFPAAPRKVGEEGS